MSSTSRITLRLRGADNSSIGDDVRIEVGVYDLLLPCRKFEIHYRVAVLGKVSPSLEFLLRLIHAVPGISEAVVQAFFDYSLAEMSYVLNEAMGPGFVERRDGRFWLSVAGEALFETSRDVPAIYVVEERQRDIGFDLLAIAPQKMRPIDPVEQALPEMPISDIAASGKVTEHIIERFARFFHEIGDASDRKQFHKRDLYSVDRVTPKERFQTPVRVRAFAQASSPNLLEINLTAWRSENEIADRPQIETAAAEILESTKTDASRSGPSAAYEVLTHLAPDFLGDFTTRKGLAVSRYWREAIRRAGEPRKDRKTVPLIGPFYTEDNLKRLISILEYGANKKIDERPDLVFFLAPQVALWGATTRLLETITLLRRQVLSTSAGEVTAHCLFRGKADRYLERTFDRIHCADRSDVPPELELLVVPRIAVVALVHAPIGATAAHPMPLGWASFDDAVISRTQEYLTAQMTHYVKERDLCDHLIDRLNPSSTVPTDAN